MGGRVVRGIRGCRHKYRPIVSQLVPSAAPRDVALALRRAFGFEEIYVADLDAIAGSSPALAPYSSLHDLGLRLWVDAGPSDAASAAILEAADVEQIVFGLETLRGPAELARAYERYGPRVIFSLDLRDGEPLGARSTWQHGDAESVVDQAVAAGARCLIVLDLARVGAGEGVGTEELCQRIVRSHPSVEVIAGGGVRGIEDLRLLQSIGVGGVLLASVLHDGCVRREELGELAGRR